MSRHATAYGRRPTRRRHTGLWLLLVVVLIALAGAGFIGARVYTQARQIKDHEYNAISMIGGLSGNNAQSLAEVSQRLPAMQRETGAAKDIAHGTLWNMLARLPFVGNDVVTVQGMTSSADSIVAGAIPKFVHAVTELQSSQLTTQDGGLDLQPLLNAQQEVSSANSELQNDVRSFNSLPMPRIGMVKTAYTSAREQLNTVATTADSLSNTLNILPDFLGSNQTRTYAVMAMTTSEARSAGGLIGSVGVMTTDHGKISIGDFKANTEYIPYGTGDPTADEARIFNQWGPLQMSFDIRDLAVYPDTSRSAEAMRAIWQRTPWGGGRQLDGVLMLDPVFLQQLIAINGNVTLSNGQVLTGSNTAEFLLNTVYKTYSPLEQDLYFQQVATQSISNMFKDVNLEKLIAIGKAADAMAKQRHISMYSFDGSTEQSLQNAGLTAQSPHDERHPSIGVYITQQNPSKMDWYIHRTSTITRNSCNADGSQTYHVQYALANTLNASQAAGLPDYIKGVANDIQTYGLEKVLIYPPADGNIANIATTGDVSESRNETMNGTAINASLAKIAPGKTVTYSFDVTTSKQSVADLAVDQTPMGWADAGVTQNFAACSIAAKK